MRPAHLLAELASKFLSKIEIDKSGTRVDAKSVLSILTLNAAQGTELSFVVTGTDAQDALATLNEFVASGFGVADTETTNAPASDK